MRSMHQQLLYWLLACLIVGSTLIGVLVYCNVKSEVDELYNAHLQQVATLLAHQLGDSASNKLNKMDPQKNTFKNTSNPSLSTWKEEDYLIQTWDQSGGLRSSVSPVHDISTSSVPLQPKAGFYKRHIDNQAWRIFRADGDQLIVQIAQPETARRGTINETSLRILLPLVLQVPLLMVLAGFAVRRGLRPLATLSQAIGKRQPHALMPLDAAALPADLQTLAGALNDLLVRLDRALQQQRNFIADAAHELRTPIAALQLQLDLLKRAHTTAARDIELAALSKGMQRATSLIQKLLEVARFETAQPPAKYVELALNRLASESIERHLPLAQARDIDLGAEMLTPIGIYCVAADIEAVLDNLLSNAIRYTPPGGRVDVAIYRDGDCAVIEVIDNGIGIPETERTLIFERFHRVLIADSENVATDGSGLGLSIVKSLCERHGATIAVEARQGSGSVFRLRWPLN